MAANQREIDGRWQKSVDGGTTWEHTTSPAGTFARWHRPSLARSCRAPCCRASRKGRARF